MVCCVLSTLRIALAILQCCLRSARCAGRGPALRRRELLAAPRAFCRPGKAAAKRRGYALCDGAVVLSGGSARPRDGGAHRSPSQRKNTTVLSVRVVQGQSGFPLPWLGSFRTVQPGSAHSPPRTCSLGSAVCSTLVAAQLPQIRARKTLRGSVTTLLTMSIGWLPRDGRSAVGVSPRLWALAA